VERLMIGVPVVLVWWVRPVGGGKAGLVLGVFRECALLGPGGPAGWSPCCGVGGWLGFLVLGYGTCCSWLWNRPYV